MNFNLQFTDLKLKLCLIGYEKVGKTSFLKRLIEQTFINDYVPTDFITKYHKQLNNTKYQFWDTSGHEKYSSLLPSYCRNSNGFFAVYDITNKYSFEKLKHFIECARKESNVPVIVIGNKCELEENRKVSKSEAQAYADENGFLFIETSAKCDINVNIAFELFAKHVSSKIRPISSIKTDTCIHRSPRSMTSRSQFIDANSNSLILGDIHTARSLDVDLRKVVTDLSDEVRILKTDNSRKDTLIKDLSKIKDSMRDSHGIEGQNVSYNEYLLKYESLIIELSEERARANYRDQTIMDLKVRIEEQNGQIENLTTINSSQSNKISEMETVIQKHEYDLKSGNNKSQQIIGALKVEIETLEKKVADKDIILKNAIQEKESISRLQNTTQTNTRVINLIGIEIDQDSDPVDFLSKKYHEYKNENSRYKSELMQLNEKLIAIESSTKDNKDITMRLESQIKSYELEISTMKSTFNEIKTERDTLLYKNNLIESKAEALREKYEVSQKSWLEAKYELDLKENKYNTNEAARKQLEQELSNYKMGYFALREQVADLLSDENTRVKKDDTEILQTLSTVMIYTRDRARVITCLENRIDQLERQLLEEVSLKEKHKFDHDTNLIKLSDLQANHANFELILNENNVSISNLSSDRLKLMTFLDRFIKLFDISVSKNFDESLTIAFGKLESFKNSHDALTKETRVKISKIEQLEQKCLSIKEQLSTKDIHLELLRKKCADLEEQRQGRSEIKVETDEHAHLNKTLEFKVNKLSEQVKCLKLQNTELKAQLLDLSSSHVRLMELEKEVCLLKNILNEAETEKNKCLVRIGSLRDEIDTKEKELKDAHVINENVISRLTVELRTTKQECEKLIQRERELLDFRESIARKFGIEIGMISMPDLINTIECFVAPVKCCNNVKTEKHHKSNRTFNSIND